MRRSLALALLLLGCGSSGDDAESGKETAQPYVTIAVAPTSAELTPGSTVQLKVSLSRGDGTWDPVSGTFSSSNDAVATVDANTGVVIAIAKGTTAITAQYGPGSAYASITVK